MPGSNLSSQFVTSGDKVTAVTGQLVKPGVISSVSSTVKLRRRNESLLYLQSTSNCLMWG